MNKKNTSWLIRILIALLFIVSAVAKLSKSQIFDSPYFAITTFEVKQLYTLGFSESVAPYFSRILIGIEFALGFLLLINHYLKRITIPITILLLTVFTIHLSYVTFLSGGNTGNCGCFGELIPMTPIQAIIKNVIAIGLLIGLFKILDSDKKSNFWILTTVTFASILFLFMLAPVRPVNTVLSTVNTTNTNNVIDTITNINTPIKTPITANNPVDSSTLKIEKEIKPNEPKAAISGYADIYPDIDKGKKILCFFAPGCDHCQATCKELNKLRLKNKNFPSIQIAFMEEETFKIPEFFTFVGKEYPYKVLDILNFYNKIGTGKNVPGVIYLHNGNVIKSYEGITDHAFNSNQFEKIVNKEAKQQK